MCLICVEFKNKQDLEDALGMIEKAKKEPSDIDDIHLDLIEFQLKSLKTVKEIISKSSNTPTLGGW